MVYRVNFGGGVVRLPLLVLCVYCDYFGDWWVGTVNLIVGFLLDMMVCLLVSCYLLVLLLFVFVGFVIVSLCYLL